MHRGGPDAVVLLIHIGTAIQKKCHDGEVAGVHRVQDGGGHLLGTVPVEFGPVVERCGNRLRIACADSGA